MTTSSSSSPITSVSLSPSSARLALATPESLVLTTPPPLPSSKYASVPITSPNPYPFRNITSLCLPSSNALYTATSTGTLTRYNLTPSPNQAFSVKAAHSTHPLTSVAALSPTSPVATAAKDGLIKLWDPNTATSISLFSGHRYEVRSIALATSTQNDTTLTLIASAGRDKTVRLWDSRTNNPITILKGHTGWVHSVALASAPSPIAVSCGGDKTVRVWDLLTMSQRHSFTGHQYRVWDVAVPATAKYCVSASTDATVRAWQIDGDGTHTFDQHNDTVLCVVAARDGRFLVSGCEDGTALLWHSQGLFGHQPDEHDLVVEEEDEQQQQQQQPTVEKHPEVKEETQLIDVGPHVAKSFDHVPKQMDTTPLVAVHSAEHDVDEKVEPTTVQQETEPPKAKETHVQTSVEPVQTEDTESLRAAATAPPEQAPTYDKSAAELVRALQRINGLENALREASDAAAVKDRELSALKSSLIERDSTIAKLRAEVETSKALVHEANVRALLDENPRKADVALDYDEPVNKIGAVSDKLTRLAARLDAMIATN